MSPASEEPSQADFSSVVLSRLASQSPAHTRYEIEGEVARGGMGAVLRVWDESLRRHLAMKVMLDQGGASKAGEAPEVDSRTLGRFLEEAQVTGQLDHPGIVPVHELGLDGEGRVYFTMKLVKGKTLREVFAELERGEGGWTQTRVLGLIQKVCDAMSYAHAKGVIHRDLKPANVMVGKYGEVYVMDWGLARVTGRDDERDIRPRAEPAMLTSEVRSERRDRSSSTPDMSLMTMDGDVVGTPAYMPPEQARGDLPAMGPHSDVYAVGAMLYHLLAGQMPYVPPDARLNNYAVWQRVQEGPPRPLSEVAPEVPAELAAICDRAMAREASARYAGMRALADDLAAYVEGRVVQAYETGAWAEARKWVRRNKPLATSLAAAVALLVLGLASSLVLKARSDAETAKVLRLSDVRVLEDLRAEADGLWPAHPESIAGLESWIERARSLISNVPLHRRTLEQMSERALPRSPEDVDRDRRSHPRFDELAPLEQELKALEQAHAIRRGEREPSPSTLRPEDLPPSRADSNGLAWAWCAPDRSLFGREGDALVLALNTVGSTGEVVSAADSNYILAWALFANGRFDEALAAGDKARNLAREGQEERLRRDIEKLASSIDGSRSEALTQELIELEAELDSRSTWRFGTREEQWRHDVLQDLIAGVETLEADLLEEGAVTSEYGWSILDRLALAKELEDGFAAGGEWAEAWSKALPAIHEAYPDLHLEAQMGLVPLGPDPESGLWEFAHLMSGSPAVREADGELLLTEETGIVLVLLPGGRFWMGAQARDPNGRNYDPLARPDESPVHEVELPAFFLSKYEVTLGQWKRLGGKVRWGNHLGPISDVDWWSCSQACRWMGMSLPSEAEWEYGARAGTTTPWSTGAGETSLNGSANLADLSIRNDDGPEALYISYIMDASFLEWLDDGHVRWAPVGKYAPNPFGLHDVHGNVEEWCLDAYNTSFYRISSLEDPRCDPVGPQGRRRDLCVVRGGSFNYRTALARSACRNRRFASFSSGYVGFRPARAIEH